jgi:hypothetical protein
MKPSFHQESSGFQRLSVALAVGVLAMVSPAARADTRTTSGVETPPRSYTRVLSVRGTVDLLSADGRRAGLVVSGTYLDVLIWAPEAGSVWRFNDDRSGCCDSDGIQEVAVAGSHVAWLRWFRGLNVHLFVETATIARPRPVPVVEDVENGEGGGDPGGDYVGNLHGDGSLLVFNAWKHCDPYGAGYARDCKAGARDIYSVALKKIVRSQEALIASSPAVMRVASVDAGRIAVRRNDGSVAVLRSDASQMRAFSFRPGMVRAVVLTGDKLVVQVGDSVSDYDLRSGRREHMWPLRGGGRLADAQSGIAIYVTPSRVHLLRLADGHHALIRIQGRGPVRAQIEQPGLFYSCTVSDRRFPGRVAFISFPQLRRLLK